MTNTDTNYVKFLFEKRHNLLGFFLPKNITGVYAFVYNSKEVYRVCGRLTVKKIEVFKGEKPEDAIDAVIKRLDNKKYKVFTQNDSKLFYNNKFHSLVITEKLSVLGSGRLKEIREIVCGFKHYGFCSLNLSQFLGVMKITPYCLLKYILNMGANKRMLRELNRARVETKKIGEKAQDAIESSEERLKFEEESNKDKERRAFNKKSVGTREAFSDNKSIRNNSIKSATNDFRLFSDSR